MPAMFRPVVALAAFALLTNVACVTSSEPVEEEEVAQSSDELISCGWLAGGDCRGIPLWGNWRSPDFWADAYLAKFSKQRNAFNNNIEAGPTPLAKPRTVVLVTGVTIKAAWFDGIKKRLERD